MVAGVVESGTTTVGQYVECVCVWNLEMMVFSGRFLIERGMVIIVVVIKYYMSGGVNFAFEGI